MNGETLNSYLIAAHLLQIVLVQTLTAPVERMLRQTSDIRLKGTRTIAAETSFTIDNEEFRTSDVHLETPSLQPLG